MEGVSSFIQNRPRTVGLYLAFAAGCGLIYKYLVTRPTGQYDYLLTLSAALQALAFAMLVCDTRSQVAEGLSEKSLWAFFIAHVARLSTTFWGEGYVPEDNTGDVYMYQLLELTGVVMLAWKLLNLTTLRTIHDVGQGMERWSILGIMAGVSLVFAYYTKSTGHNDYFADWSWMFSVWLEAFALFPQVHLLYNASHVDESAIHFAGVTLAAALAFAVFWGRNAREKYAEFQAEGHHEFFQGILTAAVFRVGLCGAYFFLFMRSSRSMKGVMGHHRGGSEYELTPQDEL